jgi:hypothetical protein
VKAEDIGPVVMADRVEVATGGQDIAEVQVGDKGGCVNLIWPHLLL